MPEEVKKRSNHIKRIRFKSDDNAVIWISKETAPELNSYRKDYLGLLQNESFDGCGVLINRDVSLGLGDKCYVFLGDMGPYLAVLRRKKKIDEHIFTLGFEYL